MGQRVHVGLLQRTGEEIFIVLPFKFSLNGLYVYRKEEALDLLAYYHANGDRDSPLVRFEFEEICTAIEEEKIQAQTGWLDFVRTPGNRKRVRIIVAIAFFSQWSGNGLVYVAFSGILFLR